MTQLLDDLHALDALFDTPDKWTQGEFARDENGVVVEYHSKDARCWCLAGGRRVVTGGMDDEFSFALTLDAALPVTSSPSSHISWQDEPGRTFADIKALIARAIAIEIAKVSS